MRRRMGEGLSEANAALKSDPIRSVRARIEGANISLDSPEAVAQWIADRKKRWPSNKVVQEKVCVCH